ncbi:MAG: DUF6684 family protein [Salinigranum sp.]
MSTSIAPFLIISAIIFLTIAASPYGFDPRITWVQYLLMIAPMTTLTFITYVVYERLQDGYDTSAH